MKAKLVVMWLTVLAVSLGTGLPVAVAEVTKDRHEGAPAAVQPVQSDMGGEGLHRGVLSVADQMAEAATLKNASGKASTYEEISANLPPEPIAEHEGLLIESDPLAPLPVELTALQTRAEPSLKEGSTDDATKGRLKPFQLAQFALPGGSRPGAGPSKDKAREEVKKLPAALKFQYAYGSDTEFTYLKNLDLNSRNKDDSLIAAPNLFFLLTYRPNAWFETTTELTLERLIDLKEEEVVILPDGTKQFAENYRTSLVLDQFHGTFKDIGPLDITVGRRNFEDERLFLYDAALDGIIVKHKSGNKVHTEMSVTRENLVDPELLFGLPTGTINNYIFYSEYRGIEDHKLAGYYIKRDDRSGKEGRPLLMGVRAYGRPDDRFNYWTELAFCRNKDEERRVLKGYAYDVGFTYRFPALPLQPSITLGYAFGSGDGNPDDNVNREFRQTGLQSNEGRFGGVTQFKRFGEFLDPELSNIGIITAGVGARLAGNAFIDLVYHYYRLDKLANELRSSGATAIMNLDESHLSKDVGSEIDIILGFRNLFGFRRLGFEARAGIFFPGEAWRIPEGYPDDPPYRKADRGISVLAVFIL